MKKLIYGLINNRKITLFFVFAIIAAGIFGYIENPKQESPDFTIPYAMITTTFPGASQIDVDASVTEPIESALKEIEGYESSSSYSSNSFAFTIVEFKFSADRDTVFRELKEKMTALQPSLPETCGTINVNTNIIDTPGVLLCLSSDELSNAEVVNQAEFIRDSLDEIDGFKRFEIIGKAEAAVNVVVDEDAMQAAGLSYSEIVALIQSGNIDIPIGEVEEGGSTLAVDYSGGYAAVEDIENLEIGFSAETGKFITLSDISDISYEVTASNTYYTHNGDEAVIIAGYFEDDINILPIKDEISEKLDDIDEDLDIALETSLIISQPEEIDESLINFSNNLLISVGLVILVVLIGMGVRNAVVVSVSLPLSVLISMGVMYLLGIKIHQISIAALIVSLGMLVDNSIVVSDSIQGYLDGGTKRKKACMQGVKDVAVPVLTSTITTVAAFMPFLFLNSMAGDYIKALPQIVSISLAASYLTAMLVIPVLGYIFFKRHKKGDIKRHSFNFFKKIIKSGMNNKTIVIIVVILLLAGSVFLALNLDTIFFPSSDKDIIYIDIKNNISDDVQSTQNIVKEISSLLDDEDGVLEYTTAAGGGLPRFNQIMYISTKTPDTGQIMMRVDLEETDFDKNEEFKTNLQDKIDKLSLDAKIVVKELMYAFPMDEDIKISITGDNLDDLKTYEGQIFGILKDTDGLVNANKGNSEYVDEYSLSVINEKALAGGLLPAEVQNEISIALMGRTASSVNIDGYTADIVVSGGNSTKDDLQSIPIKLALGTYEESAGLTELTPSSSLSTIPRYNGDYTLSLTADYDLEYDKGEVLEELKDKIDDLDIGSAKIEYGGEDELIKENFGQVGILGIVALVLVFMILMVQFKSFTMPLLIFITIPLSAIGSVLGLYITGQPISFTALLGVVSLLGIVVNNAIILIDYIKKDEANGISTKKACLNASLRRLRPILLSTITTVIGLIPLALSNSDLFKPMAVALMSGLLISTLLTLVVLPVLVSITHKDKPAPEASAQIQ